MGDYTKTHLAQNWTAQRVLDCLDDKEELIRFLSERHTKRFFDPICHLQQAEDNAQGYGFSVMALCCLLIETFQCYRQGLPSSYWKDIETLRKNGLNSTAPLDCQLTEGISVKGEDVFVNFFDPSGNGFFPDVNGKNFYKYIRCGLLHQAQTQNQWTISRSGRFWDETNKRINRNEFAERLQDYWKDYLGKLHTDAELWKNARRKIWWLVQTSVQDIL